MTLARSIRALAVAAVLAVAVAFGAFLAAATDGGGDNSVVAPASAPATTIETRDDAPASVPASGSLADLVEDVRRTVVSIGTAAYDDTGRVEGLGTGIILDRDGHILTNNHVIDGAEQITVKLWDGTIVPARVVGSDRGNDLAVVRAEVDPALLVPARLGDSDAVRPGDPVFAIGSPFAFEFTITSGIVSAVDRDSFGDGGRPIRGIIQTDAAINPGNSGGPLFTHDGEVIGINTAIRNPTGQRVFVGVGLAVPSNTALRFLPQMLRGELVRHAQIGISGLSLNEMIAVDAELDVVSGVLVASVLEDGSADRAGIRPFTLTDGPDALPRGGDVIVALDGAPVVTIQDLVRLIDLRDVGDVVTVTIIRDGQTVAVPVTLLEWLG